MSGILFMGDNVLIWLILIGVAFYLIFRYKKTNIQFINLAISCLLVILIGFSAYAIIPIRSSANPPMDENSPEDVFALASYLNREQYGETPLIYGHTYASQIERKTDGSPIVVKEKKRYAKAIKKSPDEKDRYEVVSTSPTYKYTNTMFFPRMHSTSHNPGFANHMIGYRQWGGVMDPNRKPTMVGKPQVFLQLSAQLHVLALFYVEFFGKTKRYSRRWGITKGNLDYGNSFHRRQGIGFGATG